MAILTTFLPPNPDGGDLWPGGRRPGRIAFAAGAALRFIARPMWRFCTWSKRRWPARDDVELRVLFGEKFDARGILRSNPGPYTRTEIEWAAERGVRIMRCRDDDPDYDAWWSEWWRANRGGPDPTES